MSVLISKRIPYMGIEYPLYSYENSIHIDITLIKQLKHYFYLLFELIACIFQSDESIIKNY